MPISVVLEVATTAQLEDWPTLALVLEKVVHSYVQVNGLFPGAIIPLTGSLAWLTNEIDSLRVCDLCPASPILPDSVTPLTNEDSTAHAPASSTRDSTEQSNTGNSPAEATRVSGPLCDYIFVFYHLNGLQRTQTATPAAASGGAVPLYTTGKESGAADDEEDASGTNGFAARLPCCTSLSLPHASLDGLWESLYYGEGLDASAALKRQLLQYVMTALRFSQSGVDPNLITWNRMLLFHGPPGTGKTSLAKALAQKLAVRLQFTSFPRAKLIEVNAHSLFSRWFSESGKQVTQLFEGIRQLAADPSCLVCVLLDEVESLAATRQAAMRGNEPSDAIRVVNALLTQIDALQRYRNVLVLTTSNLTDAVDPAFADRADLKVHVGPPGFEARHAMLRASVKELIKKDLLQITVSPGEGRLDDSMPEEEDTMQVKDARAVYEEVALLAHVSQGLNGRTLKKLPFLAYGLCQANQPHMDAFMQTTEMPSLSMFVRYLRKTILRALSEGEDATAGTCLDTTHLPPAKSARTENDTE